MSDSEPEPSKSRVDFVKRLFAVTVSVGFASQLSRLLPQPQGNGHTLHLLPVLERQWRDLILDLVSIIAVVASWEGYLSSVRMVPINDLGRFYIDIAIVFLYLILLLSTSFYAPWFYILTAIFALYGVWDWRKRLRPEYVHSATPGLDQATNFITAHWLLYFVVLAIAKDVKPNAGFLLAALAAASGVVFYRVDKVREFNWRRKAACMLIPLLAVLAARIVKRL